jgi:putative peptidoglycan lipid II flippase
MGYLVFTNLIATVLLMVLAEPIIRLLFQRGEFDISDAHRTATALFFLAPGLVAFSLVNVLARAFYALGDTRTPMLISSFCLAVNVVLTFMLIYPLREGGLGLANSISASLNVGLLIYGLRRKLKFLDFSLVQQSGVSLIGAALVAAGVAWQSSRIWESQIGHAQFTERLGAVFVPMALAGLAYWLILLWMKVPQARDFLDLVRRRLHR